MNDFGKVLVVYRNPIGVEHGFERFGFITHYEASRFAGIA